MVPGMGFGPGGFAAFPAFLCGSRAGDMALKLFLSTRTDGFHFQEHVLDENVSPANIAVINDGAEDLVFASHQRADEVALYRLSL